MTAEPRPLPIFELPLVLLPTERIPLHIFEERYKRMINASILERTPFGVLWVDEEGPREVGCTAEVESVLDRHDDGRLNIVVRGADRFRVLTRGTSAEAPEAEVELLEPASAEDADPTAALKAFGELLEATDSEVEGHELGDTSYEIAGLVELGTAFKQRLLEQESETERLEMVASELHDLAVAVDRSKDLSELARGNGHRSLNGNRPADD